MDFVITNGHLFVKGNDVVNKIKMADKFSTINAASLRLISLPRKIQRISTWKVQKIDDISVSLKMEVEEENKLLNLINDFLQSKEGIEIMAYSKELVKCKDKFTYLLKLYDNQTIDVLHKLEIAKFNACDGYKYAKLLSDIYKKRRKVKDILTIISKRIMDYDNKERLLHKLNNRKYTARVMTELFQ